MATGTIPCNVLAASGDASVPPGIGWEDNIPQLLFDAGTDEICYWSFYMPADYASGMVFQLPYKMASATSGAVYVEVAVMAVTPGDTADVDTPSFATVNTANDTVPGTAGYLDKISITLSNDDGAAAGDLIIVKLSRDANNGSDTATGDMEVRDCAITYTTS